MLDETDLMLALKRHWDSVGRDEDIAHLHLRRHAQRWSPAVYLARLLVDFVSRPACGTQIPRESS
jgi:hypothetical protein